jgi:hypothetical protein
VWVSRNQVTQLASSACQLAHQQGQDTIPVQRVVLHTHQIVHSVLYYPLNRLGLLPLLNCQYRAAQCSQGMAVH